MRKPAITYIITAENRSDQFYSVFYDLFAVEYQFQEKINFSFILRAVLSV